MNALFKQLLAYSLIFLSSHINNWELYISNIAFNGQTMSLKLMNL